MIDFADPARDYVDALMGSVSNELDQMLNDEMEEDVNTPPKKQFFQKYDFKWTPTQQAYLTVIKASANQLVADILSDAVIALDDLYLQARVVQKHSNGIPKKDSEGKLLWETDAYGKPKEDWKSVTNADLEKTLIKLHEIKLDVTLRVSDLYLEAVFAKYSFKDEWNEKYSSILEGTINEKTAAADRASRAEKYKAFSRYWLWYKASELQRDIASTTVMLGNIRSWRNWSKE